MTDQNPLLREVFQLGKEAMVSASLSRPTWNWNIVSGRDIVYEYIRDFFLGILPNQCQFLFRKRSVVTLN